jgi:hypothetical protein
MKHVVIVTLLVGTLILAAPASAATYYCTGTVNQLSVTSTGAVALVGAGGINSGYVCRLGSTSSNGYTPDACKAAYATLLVARATGQPVTLAFNDNLTCSTQPQYAELTGLVNLFL